MSRIILPLLDLSRKEHFHWPELGELLVQFQYTSKWIAHLTHQFLVQSAAAAARKKMCWTHDQGTHFEAVAKSYGFQCFVFDFSDCGGKVHSTAISAEERKTTTTTPMNFEAGCTTSAGARYHLLLPTDGNGQWQMSSYTAGFLLKQSAFIDSCKTFLNKYFVPRCCWHVFDHFSVAYQK